MRIIESLEEWHTLSKRLKANGWAIWQMQYDARSPEGFHIWFSKSGKRDYEVVTHNEAVQRAIIEYKTK